MGVNKKSISNNNDSYIDIIVDIKYIQYFLNNK